MPSPTAGLFGGLAQGIFGRMREHEDEQRKLDLEDKKNALSSLSSLLEQATPETRPVIYKQMADVMSLKGKHRGVWDMLTGGGRDDYHQQLSQKLDGVFGNVVGPEQYEQLKSHPEAGYGGLPAAGGPAWASPTVTQTADRTAGKIALTDPTVEREKILRATYGLRSEADSNKIWEKSAADENRQVNVADYKSGLKLEQLGQEAQLKARQDVDKMAQTLADMDFATTGMRTPSAEHIQQAAQMVGKKNNLGVEAVQALIQERLSKSKLNEFQAQGGGIDPLTGQPMGKPIPQGQKISLDREQERAADKVFTEHREALAAHKAYDTEFRGALETLQSQLKARGLYYKDGKIFAAGTNEEQPGKMRQYAELISALDAKRAKAKEQLDKAEGQRAVLGSTYKDLYDAGPDVWSVKRRDEAGSVAPAGAPRANLGQPPAFPAGAFSVPPSAPAEGHQLQSSKPYKNGAVVTMKDGQYKVTGIVGKSPGGLITYSLEKVQ